jgi:hypothetical protein
MELVLAMAGVAVVKESLRVGLKELAWVMGSVVVLMFLTVLVLALQKAWV